MKIGLYTEAAQGAIDVALVFMYVLLFLYSGRGTMDATPDAVVPVVGPHAVGSAHTRVPIHVLPLPTGNADAGPIPIPGHRPRKRGTSLIPGLHLQ